MGRCVTCHKSQCHILNKDYYAIQIQPPLPFSPRILYKKPEKIESCQMTLIGRASVNGRTGVLYARKFDQNAQNSKLDGPAYEPK